MKNFVQEGSVITVVAPSGGVVSGQLVQVGSLLGVAVTTQAAGADVEIQVTGVFELPKAADNIFQGDRLFVAASGLLTNVPGTGSKPLAGIATKAASASVSTVHCRLSSPSGITGPV